MGCRGGLMDFAFEFVINNGGIDTEKDYPYEGEDDKCVLKKEKRHVVTIDGFQDVPAGSEEDLFKAVSQQPISVAIDGAARAFQMYRGGVFEGYCTTRINHGVLAVGYGTLNETVEDEDGKKSHKLVDYWLVKNSWGAGWGDDGYIKMKRNVTEKGVCGINMDPSFPVKTSPNPVPAPTPDDEIFELIKPPRKHQFVSCSSSYKCKSGQTCSCTSNFFGFCLNYGCMDGQDPVKCEDGKHYCSSEYGLCVENGQKCASQLIDGGQGSTIEAQAISQAKHSSLLRKIFGGGCPYKH